MTGRWAAQSRLAPWLISEVSPALANVTSELVNHSWMMCHCIRRILEGAYGNPLRELHVNGQPIVLILCPYCSFACFRVC